MQSVGKQSLETRIRNGMASFIYLCDRSKLLLKESRTSNWMQINIFMWYWNVTNVSLSLYLMYIFGYLEIWKEIAPFINDEGPTHQQWYSVLLPKVISFLPFLQRILLESLRAAAQCCDTAGHLKCLERSVIVIVCNY